MKRFLDLVTLPEAERSLGAFTVVGGVESIDARDALGRVGATDTRSRDDIPHFFRSNMDGYAVRAADTLAAAPGAAVALEVIGTVAMGEDTSLRVGPGTAARISTGGMMPAEADAVVLVEHTEELPGGRVAVQRSVAPGQSTVAIGEDLRAGNLVFARGHRFRATDVGVLTGIGLSKVDVYERTRVGVIATGDEIVEPEDDLPPGKVRNVNEYLLVALARRAGAAVNDYGVIGDDAELLGRTIRAALAENHVVFVSGGSSKGAKDITRATLEDLPESTILFHGISIAPGKPTLLANAGGKAVMGVPGNPAAVAVVFTLLGAPLIRVLGGEPLERVLLLRPRTRARLTEGVPATDGRVDFTRVRLEPASEGTPSAHPLRGKSVALSTIARADGVVRIPASGDGLAAGDLVDVLLFD
jgi:molybdopterin molybdotransferase